MFATVTGSQLSEWLAPIRDQYKDTSARRMHNMDWKMFNNEKLKIIPPVPGTSEPSEPSSTVDVPKNNLLLRFTPNETLTSGVMPTSSLKSKLETTLQNAKELAAILKSHIITVQEREKTLKEAIVNGKLGVTILTVSTLKGQPRKYIIRDGFWTLCNGMIQTPTTVPDMTATIFSNVYSTPRCIGQEVTSKPDPCVFNSIIKYETIPTERKTEYTEDEYLCLKPTFNNTLEQYLSVTKKLVNATCKNDRNTEADALLTALMNTWTYCVVMQIKVLNLFHLIISGKIRSFADNLFECGLRVMSDYTYYPQREIVASELPLEYCDGVLGSCKLIVAWHLSNSSVENFEFVKDDQNFKNYFMKSGSYVNNALY
ncbi:unnamed protein product [Parnassius mnemosyne]|uniref:Uncharacterized protein n=1 Tax=Parnassius mnemosyne TaxID=213953 RepID=A0AAV1L551_9NEOP